MCGRSGIGSFLFSHGCTGAANRLDDEGDYIEGGEDDNIIHRLEERVGLPHNDRTIIRKNLK